MKLKDNSNLKSSIVLALASSGGLLSRGSIYAVIIAFDLALDLLHLSNLFLVGAGALLKGRIKQLLIRGAVSTTEAIPQSGVLAVVIVEVEVVDGVARRTIDNGVVGQVLTIVNQHSPDVDETKKTQVSQLLEREEEREDVVWQTLHVTINWVESMRGKGGRNDPLVMRLVQALVHSRRMQPTVDAVDQCIGENQEQGEGEKEVGPAAVVLNAPVKLGVALGLQNKPGHSKCSHNGNGRGGLSDLESHLILEILRVLEIIVIENEDVREKGSQTIQDPAEHSGDSQKREGLTDNVVTSENRQLGVLGGREVLGRRETVTSGARTVQSRKEVQDARVAGL